MKSFEHVYRLHRMLKAARYPVPFERVQSELECSPATTKRVIAYLRDQLFAPIETSREPRGYRYTDAAYELPGLWFSASEIQALLSLQQLLQIFQPGLLDDALAPLRGRLDKILAAQGLSSDSAGRIRLLRASARDPGSRFATVASALVQRQRLTIDYRARLSNAVTQREISPQRLTHYRDNWYLDAWCHRAGGLRTFALECIERAEALTVAAEDLADAALDAELGGAYGIFSGAATQLAELLFAPTRARWIAGERWHPAQRGQWREDGSYLLQLPYHRDEELVLDILRYGDEVEVLGPPSLRDKVAARLAAAAQRYL